jgi:hypothetical protein
MTFNQPLNFLFPYCSLSIGSGLAVVSQPPPFSYLLIFHLPKVVYALPRPFRENYRFLPLDFQTDDFVWWGFSIFKSLKQRIISSGHVSGFFSSGPESLWELEV